MQNIAQSYGVALHEIVRDLDEKDAEKAVKKFVGMLKERNELYLASKAVAAYEREARKAEGIERVRFASAESVSDAERRRISKELSGAIGKPLEIDWTADATLVAGAVIRYADILVDASVKGKLARLKQQLI